MESDYKYVLVTPARNEENTIGETIDSVLSQSVLPMEWVIVSDGSIDRTDEIVRAAVVNHAWVRLLRMSPRNKPSFAAVVRATDAGVRALSTTNYGYIGLLDSDVRFQKDYFERVLEYFKCWPRLGLAGGMVVDVGDSKKRMPRNQQDVPGAVQFFRRNCFEAIGSLLAIPEGGWDALTCARARMVGFDTRLLTDLVVDHLKPRNFSEGGMLQRKWKMGVRDYALGYHPLFEAFKAASRFGEEPFLAGGAAWWLGYCWAAIQRRERLVPRDLIEFVRGEQKNRLKQNFLLS
jgi:biofilm PGA synthesis N-glycosyltransferase PgaC